jgi:hypothetical protein
MIKLLKIKLVILLVVCFHIFAVHNVHNNGKQFYEKNTKNKIYDIGHKYLPKIESKYIPKIEMLSNIFICLPLIFRPSIIYDLITYLIPIYLFRHITTNVTILPKNKKCNDNDLTITSFFNGHCYDKIFSGHYAIAMIISLLLYYNANVDIKIIILYNIIAIFLILVTRGHYTIDVIIGGYIAITAFFLKLNIDFLEK